MREGSIVRDSIEVERIHGPQVPSDMDESGII
jgi:hypothetical protein